MTMRWNTFFCYLFIALCMSWVGHGKSIENEEEKTNEINEEERDEITVSADTSVSAEPETQTDGKVDAESEGETEGEGGEEGEEEGVAESEATQSATEAATTEAATTTVGVTTEPWITAVPTTREPEECNPDSYCQAEVLPMKLIINNTFIMCDQDIQPKERCCLPNGPHLVCYNIMVDAQHLNYDVAVAQLSTDIYSLCTALVKSQNKVQGQYTAASIEGGEGKLVFAYNKWKTLENVVAEKPQHIKDLACQIIKE